MCVQNHYKVFVSFNRNTKDAVTDRSLIKGPVRIPSCLFALTYNECAQ